MCVSDQWSVIIGQIELWRQFWSMVLYESTFMLFLCTFFSEHHWNQWTFNVLYQKTSVQARFDPQSSKVSFGVVGVRDVRGGTFSSGAGQGWKSAGRGEDENPRGGPGRAGAKKRVNWLIQKFDKSAIIVIEIFAVYSDLLKRKTFYPLTFNPIRPGLFLVLLRLSEW